MSETIARPEIVARRIGSARWRGLRSTVVQAGGALGLVPHVIEARHTPDLVPALRGGARARRRGRAAGVIHLVQPNRVAPVAQATRVQPPLSCEQSRSDRIARLTSGRDCSGGRYTLNQRPNHPPLASQNVL